METLSPDASPRSSPCKTGQVAPKSLQHNVGSTDLPGFFGPPISWDQWLLEALAIFGPQAGL